MAIVSAVGEELRAHAGRSVLSGLVLFVGACCVTLALSLSESGRQAIQMEVERSAGRAATLEARPLDDDGQPADLAPELRARLERLLAAEGSALSILRTAVMPAASLGPGGTSDEQLAVSGVQPSLGVVRRLSVVAGRWLNDDDARSLAPVLVVNVRLAARLSLDPGGVVGTTLRVPTATPVVGVVVGVLDDRHDSPELYLLADAMQRWGPPLGTTTGYLLRVPPSEVTQRQESLRAGVEQLGQVRVDIERRDDADDYANAVGEMATVLKLLASLAFLGTGVSVVALGLSTVRQRVQAFGIRRAFGARRRDIFRLVLGEALLTALVAGGLAVAATAFVARGIVAGLVDLEVTGFPPRAMAIGLAMAGAMGLVGGVISGVQATRRTVTEAIRG